MSRVHTITSLITPSPSRIRVGCTGTSVRIFRSPSRVVLFGATGDLSRRKLLCGLGYLVASDLNADYAGGRYRSGYMSGRVPGVRATLDPVGARKRRPNNGRRRSIVAQVIDCEAGHSATSFADCDVPPKRRR